VSTAADDARARIDAVAAEAGFSGVVRLERGGVVEVDAAYGLADRAHEIPMTTTTRLGLASGSKTMTALVVLRLVEDGALGLGTTARSVLGTDLPLIADDVTVEHLLAHRSGIGDYLDEDEMDPDDYPMPVSVHRLATTEDFLPILDGRPQKFAAGERFCYCNGGYVVLALLAERVGSRSYQGLVHELVLEPAGMTASGFLRSDDLPGDAALGYVEVDGHLRTNVFHLPVVATGDGGMYSTTGDLHRLWTALLGGTVVRPDTLATMTTPHSPPEEGSVRTYGLGCWLRTDSREITMSGADAGVSFASRHDPDRGYTHTVISNTGDGAWPVSAELGEIVGAV
jgi:CubicO group peptidase (beta-lactamase class C family)